MISSNQNLSLWQLGSEYQNLFSQLYDQETGEVNMEVDARLNDLVPSAEKKCLAVASFMKKLESEERELSLLQQEIENRMASYKKEINRLHDYLKTNMERCNIQEVKCPYFTIKLKKNPYSTEVFDESQLPEKFMVTREIVKVETKPDKNAIKEEVLKTGVQVPGANVSQKTKLVISIDKI